MRDIPKGQFFHRNCVYACIWVESQLFKYIRFFNVPHICCLHGCVMDVIFSMCIYRQFKMCAGILIWNENDGTQLESEMKYSKNIVGCNCNYY